MGLEFFDSVRNFAIVRPAILFFFGEDVLAVDFDFQNTSAPFDQFDVDLLVGKGLLDFGHETRGLWKVVSGNAIGDG